MDVRRAADDEHVRRGERGRRGVAYRDDVDVGRVAQAFGDCVGKLAGVAIERLVTTNAFIGVCFVLGSAGAAGVSTLAVSRN